jgi:P27 family predicted phage terminase small subunit
MSRAPITESNSPRFRPSRAKETIGQEGRPRVPRYLSKAARQRFRQIAKELELRRALTKGDGELMSLYATAWERWRTCMAHVEAEGEVVEYTSTGKNGELITREKKNLHLSIAQEAEKTMIACLCHLGFTPMNRERSKPVKKDETKAPLPVGSVGWMLAEQEKKEKENAN